MVATIAGSSLFASGAAFASGSPGASASPGGSFSTGASPSTGAPAPAITDAADLIERIAPELLAETRAPATPAEVERIQADTGISPFDARIPADPATPIRLEPAATEGAGLPVSVSIDYARSQPGGTPQASGITVYSGGDHAAAYVQPLQNGIRMLTALDSAAAGEDFSYSFGLPEGAYATELPTGDTLIADASHHYVGTLGQAWARDAEGAELATSYEWVGDTLTQHVELSEDTVFPVLLDPTWFYDYDYTATLPGYHARYPKATEHAADRLLKYCFNCFFPIAGARAAYPNAGEVLRLNASPFTIVTIPAPVKVQTANGGALQFVAEPGHFDGAGSTITFAWYNDPSGYLHLYVHAKVLVDNGAYINNANRIAAGINWLHFWQNVVDHASGSSGGGGI